MAGDLGAPVSGPPMAWSSEVVAAALGSRGPEGMTFPAISTDTRAIRAGDLFVALQGERFDAHNFLGKAREQGAGAAVVRSGTPAIAGFPFFEVADTLIALGNLARARRRRFPVGAPVVAITGSSGKTSTKELVRATLSPRFRVHATAGNLNNLVGVPLTILGAPVDAQALVVEAGANLPGEVARLRDIIEPTLAVVTNVGYAHVAGFGSLQGVMAEKVSLFDGVPIGVVGTEPPELAVEARRRTRVVVAGRGDGTDVHPDSADLDPDGHPVLRWGDVTVTLPVTGFHQIDNACVGVAVALEAGVPLAQAVRGLAAARLPGGRGAVSRVAGLLVIDDSYNANPGSLRRAVEFARWLATRQGRPLAIVVGTMLELGGESDRLHAAAAAEIMAAEPALVGAVGAFESAFAPHRGALGDRLLAASDAEHLGPMLKAALRGTEVVLLKGSRGVALERILRYLN